MISLHDLSVKARGLTAHWVLETQTRERLRPDANDITCERKLLDQLGRGA